MEQRASVARIAEALSSRRINFEAVCPLAALPDDWEDSIPTLSAGAAMYVETEEDSDPHPRWWSEKEVLLDSEPRWEGEEEEEEEEHARKAAPPRTPEAGPSTPSAKAAAAAPPAHSGTQRLVADGAGGAAARRAAPPRLSRELAGHDLLITAGGDDAFLSAVRVARSFFSST